MDREPLTLEQIKASRPQADRAKIAATTEADIRRQQIEDGEDPDAPLPPFRLVPKAGAGRVTGPQAPAAPARAVTV